MVTNRVQIQSVLSPDLALRDNANYLFTFIETLNKSQIILDFAKVRSISRSFAHQYLTNKRTSKVTIQEANVPEHVQRMFEAVSNTKKRSVIEDLDSIQTITL
jgi:hypothetical protein